MSALEKMTKEDIIQSLKELKRDAERITSGNAAHQRTHIMGTAQWLIDEISEGNTVLDTTSKLNIGVVINWVAVKDKLPDNGSWVLAYSPNTGRHIAWYEYQWADRAEYVITNVTHWAKIPEPPCL